MVLVILVWSTFHPIFEETFPYLAIVGGAKLGRIFSSRHLREKKTCPKKQTKRTKSEPCVKCSTVTSYIFIWICLRGRLVEKIFSTKIVSHKFHHQPHFNIVDPNKCTHDTYFDLQTVVRHLP